MKPKFTPFQRIWRFLDLSNPNGCWIWTGIVNSWGYGAFVADGKRMVAVHRWLYQQFYGPLGRWEFCLHKCDTPRCVNPAHLYVGNAKNNVDDMMTRGRDRFRGEYNIHAKLTTEAALDILRSKPAKPRTRGVAKALAAKHGVGVGAVHAIWRGDHWRHTLMAATSTTSHD